MAAETQTAITVIEHVVEFKFKDGYTEEQELDMYKGLWSFKYYFPSIMAMSLGRVLAKNADGVTHVLVMRFASKEALATYMADDYRKEISYKTIVPFFNGEYTQDFEAEVPTDLSAMYKEGERFNQGIEHVDLFKVKEGTSTSDVEELMNIVANLPKNLQTDVVQLTSGTNYRSVDKYTYAIVFRLPSVEGLQALIEDPAYVDMRKKANPILDDHLSLDFIVEESAKRIQGHHSAFTNEGTTFG